MLTLSLQRTGGDLTMSLVEEDGAVQMLSAFGYLACAAVMAARFGIATLIRHWYMPLLLLTLTLRELDFHNRLTSQGVFKTSFYFSGEVPLSEKLLALPVIALILVAAFTLARRHLGDLMRNARRLHPAAVAISVAAACAVASKLADGLARKLSQLGIMLSETTNHNAIVLEELLELAIPLALIVAVCLTRTTQRQANTHVTLPPSQLVDTSHAAKKAA